MNKLYYGDNLSIMEGMAKYSVDLVYLDPPFKSQQNYNLLYKTLTGKPVPEQAEAFCDTWEMDAEKDRIARNMPVLMKQYGVEQYYVDFWRLWMQALRHTQPHLLAYLIYMVQRLLHMKIILKPTGSIYLHCDPTAGHYIKVMMDGIFGHNNFRSEIIWRRTGAHNSSTRWGPIHDVILFYTISDEYTWNHPRNPYMTGHVQEHFVEDGHGGYKTAYYGNVLTGSGVRKGASGKPWKGFDPTAKSRHWAIPRKLWEDSGLDDTGLGQHEKLDLLYEHGFITITEGHAWPIYERKVRADDGPAMGDIWAYQPYTEGTVFGTDDGIDANVSWLKPRAKERLGFPTQKPVNLLKRIVEASSDPGNVVFDPFCGCGTTIYAAHEAGRSWIGCDVAILAVRLVEGQLKERYGLIEGEHYEEHGIPNSMASALALFQHDPFQFEHWAVEYVGGFPTKKTGDKGIDGRIYFETKKELGLMVLSVKGGNVRPTDIRDLIGVLSVEEGAELAGFISNKEPSKAMKAAAAQAGQWEYEDVAYDRVQLLTVKEIVEDKKRFHTPTKIGTKSATADQIPLAV